MKYARKLSSLFMWLLYVQLLGGQNSCVCVSRYDKSAQTRRQKVFTRVALRLRRLGIENLLNLH